MNTSLLYKPSYLIILCLLLVQVSIAQNPEKEIPRNKQDPNKLSRFREWKDELNDPNSRDKNKIREYVQFAFQQGKKQNFYQFKETLGFYKRAGIEGKMPNQYKIIVKINNKKTETDDILNLLIIDGYELSKATRKPERIKKAFLKHHFTYNDDSIHKILQFLDFQIETNRELLDRMTKESQKLIFGKNFDSYRSIEKDTLSFQKKSDNDDERVVIINLRFLNLQNKQFVDYEVGYIVDQFELKIKDVLFYMQTHSGPKLQKTKGKTIKGPCPKINSFFICSLRQDCTTKQFQKQGVCIEDLSRQQRMRDDL